MQLPAERELPPPTTEQQNLIAKWAYDDLLLSNAARHAKVHPTLVEAWMNKGSEDAKDGINSAHSSFYLTVREKQSKKISETLAKISSCPRNWQSLAWFLEKCFREDFSNDAELYKSLLDDYKRIIQDVTRMAQDSTVKGVTINGELDKGRNQKERRT